MGIGDFNFYRKINYKWIVMKYIKKIIKYLKNEKNRLFLL